MYSAPAWVDLVDPDTGETVSVFYPAVERLHTNSHDTGPMTAEFTNGSRIEVGRVHGGSGWMAGVFQLTDQVQTQHGEGVDVVFQDIPFVDSLGYIRYHLEGQTAFFAGYDGTDPQYILYYYAPDASGESAGPVLVDLPISFDVLDVENRVNTWGVELMYLHRLGQGQRGGFLEMFAGVRYLEFNETTQVDLRGVERTNSDGDSITTAAVNWRFIYDGGSDADPTTTTPSIIGPGVALADCNWTTEANNHIVGPQIGLRWARKQDRWSVVAEGRFLAGLNIQNVRNHGVLGSELGAPSPWSSELTDGELVNMQPYMLSLQEPYYFDNAAHIAEFSPAGELRVKFVFDVTRALSLNIGWEGLWMGGIARGIAMSDWTISEESVMGINRNNNDQSVFINGVNFGVTVNR
jgi:hypothetical protein